VRAFPVPPTTLRKVSAPTCAVGELVEEELLLALPIVPLHAQASDCAVPVDVPAASGALSESGAPEQTTQKPFAQLDKLLKR